MKAFVTGATGLLGGNLVRQLIAQGYEVTGLVRSEEKARRLLGDLPVRYAVGDMEDVDGFAGAMRGSDVVFHTAAYFREYFGRGDHWSKLQQINVDGTVKVLEAAEKAGVGKAIYTSSSSVHGMKPDGSPGDETTPPDIHAEVNLYARSKVLAEAAVDQFLSSHSLPVVLVQPSAMFGPGDAAPTTSGQLVIDTANGKVPAIAPGGYSTVDVRDVAAAMITAVERGQSGERYVMTGAFCSIADIMRVVSDLTGTPLPRFTLSDSTALTFARMSEFLAGFTGNDPLVTRAAVRLLTARRVVASDKAARELGFSARPFKQTLADAVAWFGEHGYLTGKTIRAAA